MMAVGKFGAARSTKVAWGESSLFFFFFTGAQTQQFAPFNEQLSNVWCSLFHRHELNTASDLQDVRKVILIALSALPSYFNKLKAVPQRPELPDPGTWSQRGQKSEEVVCAESETRGRRGNAASASGDRSCFSILSSCERARVQTES